MHTLLSLLQLLFSSIGAFLLHFEGLLILGIALVLAGMQYRRAARLEQELYGLPRNQPLPLLGDALVHGVLAGTVVSLVATLAGISLVQPPGGPDAFAMLWMLALGMSLAHPRFICFAYGTSLLSLSYLLFGWPQVDIPGLTGLIAVLHLAEALLIAIGGDRCATPLTFGRPGQAPVAGFQLQRFWPVLLVLPIGLYLPESALGAGTIELWSWWPVIRPDPTLPEPTLYALVPVAVIMGYGDLAISAAPRQQAHRSALRLAVYSLVLFGLAIASAYYRPLQWVAALFSALGHEAVIWLGARAQVQGKPWLERARRGVTVLDTLPGTPAALGGLRTGSVILEVDGRPVYNREELHTAMLEAPAYLQIVFRNDRELEFSRIPRPEGGVLGFGAILVPEPDDRPLVLLGSGQWQGWVQRLARRLRRNRRDAA